MGATDEEISEAVHMAASVGAGVALAMAERSRQAAEAHYHWWKPPKD